MTRLLIILTFLVLLAAGWFGLRRISKQDDRARFNALQNELNSVAEEITGLEGVLLSQASTFTGIEENLSDVQAGIEEFEQAHPDGIPTDLYPDYEREISRYNNLVQTYNEALASYNTIFENYGSRIDHYNTMVEEANALAATLGSTWSVGRWLADGSP
jgi:septation ring formation regulator EzrA